MSGQQHSAGTPLGVQGLREHPDRAAALGELHARPFAPIAAPCRIYHFAFLTSAAEQRADRAEIARMSVERGAAPPAGDANFHRLELGAWSLRWEGHTEFTTYTWSTGTAAEQPFHHADPLGTREIAFQPPGQLLAAVHMSLVAGAGAEPGLGGGQHRSMLCMVNVIEGGARLSTDFLADANGFVRFLVEQRSLTPTRAGRLVQRVLELETYRMLALLGLPEARRISPALAEMERELDVVTQAIGNAGAIAESHALLNRLSALSARIEAQTAATAFRFAATRAYHRLVRSRLESIDERREGEHVTISAFLDRRFGPAMETCEAVQARQGRLSAQVARAAELLSTRIQFELEQQNRSLLQSMNRRAKLQLRLQETVEGLSVAAISYYMVGLVGYVAKGAKEAGLLPKWLAPELAMALCVPLVIGGIWLTLRQARKSWSKPKADNEHEA